MSEINVRPEDSRCAEFVRPLEKTRVQIRLITRSRDRCHCLLDYAEYVDDVKE